MKILIGILIFLAVVVGIIAIIPAFIDPEVTVTRSIEIDKPVDVVYNVTKNYNNYLEWNPWSQLDPKAKHSFSGTPGEIGSSWTWDGNPDSIGTGTLTLEETVPNTSIKGKLEFKVPFESTAEDLWYFKPLDSTKTSVTWSFKGSTDSYFMRYMNLATESMLGPQLDQGLKNLKEYVESIPAMPDTVTSPGEAVIL